MATNVQKLTGQAAKSEAATEHYGRLLAALSPNPEEWEYTGEYIDLGSPFAGEGGRCACGHYIRWAFIIRRVSNAEQTQVGSTCIEHFQQINEATYTHLVSADKKLKEELAAAQKSAKQAKQEAEADEAKAEFDEAYQKAHALYKSYQNADMKAPRTLWEVCAHYSLRIPSKTPTYQRVSSYLKWYKKQTAALKNAVIGCEFQESVHEKHATLRALPDVSTLHNDFQTLRQKVVDAYRRYEISRRRAPRKIWEVVYSDKWGIPPEPPIYLIDKEELVQWYHDNMDDLREAENTIKF